MFKQITELRAELLLSRSTYTKKNGLPLTDANKRELTDLRSSEQKVRQLLGDPRYISPFAQTSDFKNYVRNYEGGDDIYRLSNKDNYERLNRLITITKKHNMNKNLVILDTTPTLAMKLLQQRISNLAPTLKCMQLSDLRKFPSYVRTYIMVTNKMPLIVYVLFSLYSIFVYI